MIQRIKIRQKAQLGVMALLLAGVLSGCTGLSSQTSADNGTSLDSGTSVDSGTSADIGVSTESSSIDASSLVDIQILATSDQHGRFLPYNYELGEEDSRGSTAQLATKVKELRAENPNTLLVDAGDSIQGNMADIFFDEEVHPMMLAYNLMDYDVCVPGNHEFNHGVDIAKRSMGQLDADVLCANVYDKDQTTRLLGPDYKIYEVAGVKIAMIGVTSPNITIWDKSNLTGYRVTDPADEINAVVKEIRDEVDVVVVVAHVAEDNEYSVANSGAIDLANNCPGIDLIIASHGHHVYNQTVNGVPIVENVNVGRTLAICDLKLNQEADGGYDLVDIQTDVRETDPNTVPDEKLVAALAPYDQEAREYSNEVIGHLVGGSLSTHNEVSGIAQVIVEDTAVADLINDVQLYYAGAQVSASSPLSSHYEAPEGDITRRIASSLYRYENMLYKVKMNGKQLRTYMEWSAGKYKQIEEGDLSVAYESEAIGKYDIFTGVKYEVNISRPEGERIENLRWIDDQPVQDTDEFIIAVNSYRWNTNLSGYGTVYSEEDGDELPILMERDIGGSQSAIRDLLIDYIQNVNHGEITPKADHNWRIVGKQWNESVTKLVAQAVKDKKITIWQKSDSNYHMESAKAEDLADQGVIAIPLDLDGGSGITQTFYAVTGEPYGTLPTPTKDGATFLGWKDAGSGKIVTAEDLVPDGAKLIATWK